jgi:hypothetical protein
MVAQDKCATLSFATPGKCGTPSSHTLTNTAATLKALDKTLFIFNSMYM